MRDDDFPPLPYEAPLAPGGFRGWFWDTFLGPANAAGLGGWAGVFGPIGAYVLWFAASGGGPTRGPELVLQLVCAASASLLVGVLAGGLGSRAVCWVERRRGERWPPWRAQFLGGFVAGMLEVIALAAVGATLASGW